MGFGSEEDLEAWYAGEKEKLDGLFASSINSDPENIPLHRSKYELNFKKLISRYQLECEKLMLKQEKK